MNDNVEIIRSNKGGMKIIHRGYMYTVHKKRQGGGIRWRCTQRSLHCKGSISTGNGPPSVNMPHNHIPDPHSVALARCRQLEEFPDIASLLETEYDDTKDSMPLQQRMTLTPPQVQIPPSSFEQLHSQPVSPTKLKVTRQTSKPITSKVAETPQSLPPDEVCLRWNSHHSNMQTRFPELLEKEQYVDVTLMAEEDVLKCHRMILSSCSTYFENILSNITPMQHPVIILKGIPFWILKALIDFMYVGEINIDQNKLPELLDVAEVLKVKGLAGKNTGSDQKSKEDANSANSTNSANLTKKKHPKDAYVKAQGPSKNALQSTPVVTKIEERTTNDSLELFESKSQEDMDAQTSKVRDKLTVKKVFGRKIRKRKASDEKSSPPLFPMRRGTRSRPNVKIPKYYDYEDIVKSSNTETRPFSPVMTIKSEPPDIDENDITFNENEHSSVNVSNMSKNASLTNCSTTSNEDANQTIPETESAIPTSSYKIKIKCLSGMSDKLNCTMGGDVVNTTTSEVNTINPGKNIQICDGDKINNEVSISIVDTNNESKGNKAQCSLDVIKDIEDVSSDPIIVELKTKPDEEI